MTDKPFEGKAGDVVETVMRIDLVVGDVEATPGDPYLKLDMTTQDFAWEDEEIQEKLKEVFQLINTKMQELVAEANNKEVGEEE